MPLRNRREFMSQIALPTALTAAGVGGLAQRATAHLAPQRLPALVQTLEQEKRPARELATDESFWFEIQQAFTVDRSLVNLNNGGVSPAPATVQAAMERHLAYSHQAPAYTMWKVLEPQRETVRSRLARTFGCDPEEIALTRNASESLHICQFGFDLKPGDEVLTTNQDYPRMIHAFQQRRRREGIHLRQFSIPVPAEDPDEVVARFAEHLTPRTRLILMCHMINLTGQVLPVARVTALGRRHGIPVIVDGAHTFAHFAFTQRDLDCDYYATSLHKWLFAPHGTGMLYVRREKVRDLWPLMAAPEKMDDDIRKFEEIGTHPAANYLAVAEALTLHQGMGGKAKEARLVYLRDRWARRLLNHDGVRLHTSLEPGLAYGLCTVEILGTDPGDLANHLWDRHRILVAAIRHDEFQGIRVTPSVYTTLEEIDRFGDILERVAKHGLA